MLFSTQILGSLRGHARGVALALRLTPVIVMAGLGLTGCGQKGPLYLPTPAEQPANTSKIPTSTTR